MPALVVLATAATVIASQATISGAYSVTRQAVQLDLLPRVRVLQTSATTLGQIYVPAANLFMFVAVVLFVIGFGSSSALSAAYGASVVGTMIITTLLGALVARTIWNWSWQRVGALFGVLLLVDLAFVAGNFTKIDDGGWVPLALAAVMFAIFVTWRDGRLALRAELALRAVPIKKLPELLASATRVPGTAVFLVSHSGFVPTALLRNLEHNKVCHERIVILHIEIPAHPARRSRMPGNHRRSATRRVRRAGEIRVHGNPGYRRGIARRTPPETRRFPGRFFVLPRLAPGTGAPASGHRGHQVAHVRIPAAAQRAGRGILPHADAWRDGAGYRHRTVTAS